MVGGLVAAGGSTLAIRPVPVDFMNGKCPHAALIRSAFSEGALWFASLPREWVRVALWIYMHERGSRIGSAPGSAAPVSQSTGRALRSVLSCPWRWQWMRRFVPPESGIHPIR